MDVLGSAFRHAVAAPAIEHALRHAAVVDEIGEDPTRYLVLGPDRAGNLLELVVLDRLPGAGSDPRDAHENQVPEAVERRAVNIPTDHGNTPDGAQITDVMLEALAEEAERGYDVDAVIRRRRGGRPAMGSAAASVESVRLDPELRGDLLLRAAADHISVSETIRRAIGQYLHAS